MMDLYFFVKTLILTLALVVVLQLKIGNHSLEDHAMMTFKGSMIEMPLENIAKGGAQLIRDVIETIQEKVNGPSKKGKSQKKSSGFHFNWSPQ